MNTPHPDAKFGPVTLFGSGETLPASGKAYELIARSIEKSPRISIIETPAGFQPNSTYVAQKVADFIEKRLQNYDPDIILIPARKNQGNLSTNNLEIFEPMFASNWVFLGPGSPTYTVKHLTDSKLFEYLCALHATGCALTLSSAAVLAFSAFTLPVYEIYKVGEDLHWMKGLNFFSRYGLDCVVIPHWNNNSGGEELDTRRCYMGLDRFVRLKKLLPRDIPIIGIDEQTALTITFAEKPQWTITGNGRVTIQHQESEKSYTEGIYLPSQFGFQLVSPDQHTSRMDELVNKIEFFRRQDNPKPSEKVIELAQERLAARNSEDWKTADNLRDQIENLGWKIQDTAEGYDLEKI